MIALLNVETNGVEPIVMSVQPDGQGRPIVIHVQLDTMERVVEVHKFFLQCTCVFQLDLYFQIAGAMP